MKDNILALIIMIVITAIMLFFFLPFVLILLSALAKYLWSEGIEIWQALFQMW